MSDCPLCIEPYTALKRKCITCPFAGCGYQSCSPCTQHYLLDRVEEPHCMGCKRAWSREFLLESFPKVFVEKRLKEHREEVLIDLERALLPATQPAIERIIYRKRCTELPEVAKLKEAKEELLLMKARSRELCEGKWMIWRNTPEYEEWNEEYKLTRHHYKEAKMVARKADLDLSVAQVRLYNEMFHQAHDADGDNGAGPSEPEKKPRKEFVRACPHADCRGFLSTQWHCSLCDNWTCKDCHEVIGASRDDPHQCKPESVETVKLLAKDTKPCPKCACLIFRVSGCSQMWCTQCHTTFDWNTGKEDVDPVQHNPHYLEWAGRNRTGVLPRQLGACDDATTNPHNFLILRIDNALRVYATLACRYLNHVQWVELPRYNYERRAYATNEDLRIRYLLKEIDEKKWKSLLHAREKRRRVQGEIHNLLRLFDDVGRDILNRLYRGATAPTLAQPFSPEALVEEFKKLLEYVNEQLAKVAKTYGTKALQLEFKGELEGGELQ